MQQHSISSVPLLPNGQISCVTVIDRSRPQNKVLSDNERDSLSNVGQKATSKVSGSPRLSGDRI